MMNDKCDNPSILVNNTVICNFTASRFPVCTIETGGCLLLDFGKELSGGIRLVSGMMKPATLRLRFGESIAEACGEPNMDHAIHDVVLPLNLLTCMDFGNTGFRYVRLDVLEGQVKLVNAIAIASMQELEQIGNFTCSDQRLNQIFDTAVYTAHLCIQEHILDGIKRDRLLWGGDLHPTFNAILPIFGSIDAMDATLEQLCFNTVEGSFANNHTSYTLWLLMTIHDWYMHSGDASILQKYGDYITENTQKYLAMVKPDGTLEMPGYLFLDWLSHDDTAGTLAGLYGLFILAMKAAENLYSAMHLDTTELIEAQKRVAARAPSPGRNKSAAALQHLAGVADRRDILQTEPFSGISTFIGGYILQCLEPCDALELVKRYWGGMLDMGATTFWEDFDLDWLENAARIDEITPAGKVDVHGKYGAFCYEHYRHSLCHGWASGPVPFLARHILGITVLEPGCKRLRIEPHLGDLEYAKGTFPTPLGMVYVSYVCKSDGTIETKYEAPEGIEIQLV